jgi:hypothetical protein
MPVLKPTRMRASTSVMPLDSIIGIEFSAMP